MDSLSNLTAISTKIASDIDTKLAAAAAKATADAATIADLQTQLDAFKTDQVAIDAAVQTLTTADAKLTA